jgi:hypothetical protein
VAVIGIVYEEYEPETYDGVKVNIGDSKGFTIQVGTPENDFSVALIIAGYYGIDLICSSSVDHFVMDGGDLGVYS